MCNRLLLFGVLVLMIVAGEIARPNQITPQETEGNREEVYLILPERPSQTDLAMVSVLANQTNVQSIAIEKAPNVHKTIAGFNGLLHVKDDESTISDLLKPVQCARCVFYYQDNQSPIDAKDFVRVLNALPDESSFANSEIQLRTNYGQERDMMTGHHTSIIRLPLFFKFTPIGPEFSDVIEVAGACSLENGPKVGGTLLVLFLKPSALATNAELLEEIELYEGTVSRSRHCVFFCGVESTDEATAPEKMELTKFMEEWIAQQIKE